MKFYTNEAVYKSAWQPSWNLLSLALDCSKLLLDMTTVSWLLSVHADIHAADIQWEVRI